MSKKYQLLRIATMTENELLKEQAYNEIKVLLRDGPYEPGTFLSERELARRLGMSNTPVRAALERLEVESFVSIYPRQGILVRELSLQEIKDHYGIRIALETFVVAELAGRLSDDKFDVLEGILAKQHNHLEAAKAQAYMQTDADFHLQLCNFLGNQEITRAMKHQRDKLYRVVLQLLERDMHHMWASYNEHMGIFQALKMGEGRLAAERMREHFENGLQVLLTL